MDPIKTEQVQTPLTEAEIVALPLDKMREAIDAQVNKESSEPSNEVVETPSEETTETVTEEQAEETTETESTEETVEQPEASKIANDLKAKLDAKEQQFKELQGQFTKDRQKIKELESKLDLLVSLQKGEPKEGESQLDALKKVNPEAATLLESLFKAQEEKLNKKLEESTSKLKEERTSEIVQRNVASFQAEVDAFLKSDLAPLGDSIAEIINSDFEGWQKRIHESPNTFKELYKEVIASNLDKVAELKAKKSKPSNSKEKEEAQPGTKSKGTLPKVDSITPELMKNMSFDEVEALRKKGVISTKDES